MRLSETGEPLGLTAETTAGPGVPAAFPTLDGSSSLHLDPRPRCGSPVLPPPAQEVFVL